MPKGHTKPSPRRGLYPLKAALSGPTSNTPCPDRYVLVTARGRICICRKKINVSTVLAGQRLGINEVDERIWLVSFIDYDLGDIDLEQSRIPCSPSCACALLAVVPLAPNAGYVTCGRT